MFLIDPEELKSSVGLVGTQGTSTVEIDQIKAILTSLIPAIEGPCNVATLLYVSNQDRFAVPVVPLAGNHPRRVMFRLTNAFLDTPTIEVIDPLGVEVDPANLLIDKDLGTIQIEKYIEGEYTVNYRSGFKLPPTPEATEENPNPPQPLQVFQGVPLFIKAAIIAQFTLWMRSGVMNARLPKDIKMFDAEMGMRRRFASTIYSVYDRPRNEVLWPIHHAQS